MELEELATPALFNAAARSPITVVRRGRVLLDQAVPVVFERSSVPGCCAVRDTEQSLDIDADLIITDLAPMDVLLNASACIGTTATTVLPLSSNHRLSS